MLELKTFIPIVQHRGVPFLDIGPLLANCHAFGYSIDRLARMCEQNNLCADVIAGFDARGFIVGAALAQKLGIGFVMLRKEGTLPPSTGGFVTAEYQKEYDRDQRHALQAHCNLLGPSKRVLLVDDILATMGTMIAGISLVEQSGSTVVACLGLIELSHLNGRVKIPGYQVLSLLEYTS